MDVDEVARKGCTRSRCYPWFICSLSFLVQFLAMSFYGSFGPLYVEMLRVFKQGDSTTAWIPSISFCIAFMIAPITYPLGDRFGFRKTALTGSLLYGLGIFISSFASSIGLLYFTIGVMVATGYSLCQATSMFILRSYFSENWALPLGIALSGSGIGALTLSSIKAFLFDRFGYRIGMQILSISAIPLALAGLMFKKTDAKTEKSETKDSPDIDDEFPRLSRNKAFYMLLVASFFFHSVYLITLVHLTRLAGDLGISDTKSALLPGILTLSESAGKILLGKLHALFRRKTLTFYQLSWAGMSLALLMCPFAKNFYGLAAFSVVWGFCAGGQSSSCVLAIGFITGNKNVVNGYSIFLMCLSPATLIGPPLAGYIRETMLNYDIAFYLSGGIVAIAASLLFAVKFLHHLEMKKGKTYRANQIIIVSNDKDKQELEIDQQTKDSERDSMLSNNEKTIHYRKQHGNTYKDGFFFNLNEPTEEFSTDKNLFLNIDDLNSYLDRETTI